MLLKCSVILIILVGLNIVKALTEYPYCFRFTWIGPYDVKEHIGNETCGKRLQDSTNIPCERPIVATDNDNIPDTDDLWENYKYRPDDIACHMVPGERCVKYTYVYNKGEPYCFDFTWIVDNDGRHDNETCEDRLGDIHNIACTNPIVFRNDVTKSNYICNNSSVLCCHRRPGWSCVKYSYIFNEGVQNITYMCAKVNATAGCYHQKYISGLKVEVCVCESQVGGRPCNAKNRLEHKLSLLLIALITITIFYKLFQNS